MPSKGSGFTPGPEGTKKLEGVKKMEYKAPCGKGLDVRRACLQGVIEELRRNGVAELGNICFNCLKGEIKMPEALAELQSWLEDNVLPKEIDGRWVQAEHRGSTVILRLEERRVRCPKCGYQWYTRSTRVFITCPNCMRKVKPIPA